MGQYIDDEMKKVIREVDSYSNGRGERAKLT